MLLEVMVNVLQSVFIAINVIFLVIIVIFSFNQAKMFPTRMYKEIESEMVFNGSGIPRVVHYTYMHEMLPIQYHHLIDTCLKINLNVTFVFWTDQDAYDLVKNHYSDRLDIYNSYVEGVREKLKKSDLIRPLILHRYGGVYMDLDTLCQKPLAPVLNKDSCIISTDVDIKIGILYNMDFLLMNSFMACIPQHHFFGFVIKSMTKNKYGNILTSTGPMLLTNLYGLYRRVFLSSSKISTDPRYKISVGDWRIFSPHLNPSLKAICGKYLKSKKTPETSKERGCHLLHRYLDQYATDFSNATVVHMFLHLGYTQHIELIKETFNISVQFPQILKADTII